MIILGAIVSLALLAVIIRFALSPQTDRLVKRAAIIALALIGLALVACLVIVFTGPKATEEAEVFAGLPLAESVTVVNSGRIYMLLLGFVMLLLVGLIILLSLRDEKKKRMAQGRLKPPG
jgi:formate hydrogenlyase subunit 3/multisubunit Na+/H+ antiporter MnhD subunit